MAEILLREEENMGIFGVAQITRIADLHIKVRINNNARLHLYIPRQVRAYRQAKDRIVGLAGNILEERKSFGFFSLCF